MKPVPMFDYQPSSESFTLQRDKQPLKTPAGLVLSVPTKPLAEIIVKEWSSQGDKPKPASMPFTQLAMTAIDIISKKRADTVASLAAYAESDLLCHCAEEPPGLTARQAQTWNPWLEWAAKKYATQTLHVGHGIMPIAQPKKTLDALHNAVDSYGTFHLAGLQQAVGVTGSLILGLALVAGNASSAELFAAAELETLFQIEKWGEDPVTTERHANIKRELTQCEQWFKLLAA
jgi:chaperone required for assembly of F1-ATPase